MVDFNPQFIGAVNYGRPRLEILNGRKMLVVPATMIVPGVLNGSNGPLLYPADEIKAGVYAWNGVPLTLGHPEYNGTFVSGRNPSILNEYGLGWVFNSRIEKTTGKLVAEAWFDIELVKNKSPKLMGALYSGTPIELSTGLDTFTDKKPGKTTNGIEYSAIARNHKPDHLAVLMDQRGACSLNDGCGLMVNAESSLLDELSNNQKETEMPKSKLTDAVRKSYVSGLTKNCECWKDGEKTLNSFSDDQLQSLAVANGLAKAEEKDVADILLANQNPPVPPKKDEEGADDSVSLNEFSDEDIQKEMNRRAKNKKKNEGGPPPEIQKKIDEKNSASTLNAEDQAALTWAKNERRRQRVEIVRELVGNSGTTGQQREALIGTLGKKSLEDLQELQLLQGITGNNSNQSDNITESDLIGNTGNRNSNGQKTSPQQAMLQRLALNYSGQTGYYSQEQITANADVDDADDMVPRSINWSENAQRLNGTK